MAGFKGTIHPHLTGRPGVAGATPARTRTLVKLPAPLPIPPFDGSKIWREIHEVALTADGPAAEEWLSNIRMRLPCGECRAHWDGMLVSTPPDWANFFEWTVARHNEVNVRLGKPVMAKETARELYSKSRHA